MSMGGGLGLRKGCGSEERGLKSLGLREESGSGHIPGRHGAHGLPILGTRPVDILCVSASIPRCTGRR